MKEEEEEEEEEECTHLKAYPGGQVKLKAFNNFTSVCDIFFKTLYWTRGAQLTFSWRHPGQ